MSFRVDASDLLAHLERARVGFTAAVPRALKAIGHVAWEAATQTSAYKDHSPTGLRAKTSLEIVSDGITTRATIAARKRYASFVENGSKAVSGKLMRFVVNGAVLFRRSRKAIPARPFMRPAEKAGELASDAIANREVDAALK